jgi:hypothetical protein
MTTMTRTERVILMISTIIVGAVSLIGVAVTIRAQEDRAALAARVTRFCDNQRDEILTITAVRDTHALRERIEHRLGNATVTRLCLDDDLPGPAETWQSASACWINGGGDACYLDLARLLADAYWEHVR